MQQFERIDAEQDKSRVRVYRIRWIKLLAVESKELLKGLAPLKCRQESSSLAPKGDVNAYTVTSSVVTRYVSRDLARGGLVIWCLACYPVSGFQGRPWRARVMASSAPSPWRVAVCR